MRIVGSSMPSRIRRRTVRAADTSVNAIATVMSSPTMASERGNPAITPIAPATTPSEVSPSARACAPSATSAAEPIAFPTRIRYSATVSFPTKPSAPAISTTHTWSIGAG